MSAGYYLSLVPAIQTAAIYAATPALRRSPGDQVEEMGWRAALGQAHSPQKHSSWSALPFLGSRVLQGGASHSLLLLPA